MRQQQVGQRIGLVARQAVRGLIACAVHEAHALVVALVAQPVVESAATIRRHVVLHAIGAVQVPFADVGRVMAGGLERRGQSRDGRIERARRADHADLVRVAARQHGGAERASPYAPEST